MKLVIGIFKEGASIGVLLEANTHMSLRVDLLFFWLQLVIYPQG